MAAIGLLTNLVFELLGGKPQNYFAKRASHDAIWRLDRYRKVNYSVSDRQRADLALDLARSWMGADDARYREMQDKFYMELKEDAGKFLAWLAGSYPEQASRLY